MNEQEGGREVREEERGEREGEKRKETKTQEREKQGMLIIPLLPLAHTETQNIIYLF